MIDTRDLLDWPPAHEDDWYDQPTIPDEADYYPEHPFPSGCPQCGGDLTVDPEDREVGLFGDAFYCENTLDDGTLCDWEGATV